MNRKDFLKVIGGAALGSTVIPFLPKTKAEISYKEPTIIKLQCVFCIRKRKFNDAITLYNGNAICMDCVNNWSNCTEL